MSSNVSSNFPEDGTGHCQLSQNVLQMNIEENESIENVLLRELDILCPWHQIPKSEWGDKKKMTKWMELKDKKPPFFDPWTDADER